MHFAQVMGYRMHDLKLLEQNSKQGDKSLPDGTVVFAISIGDVVLLVINPTT
jgi:hypothetical protein